MNDMLLRIAERPVARKILERSGLPIPMPEPLVRVRGAYVERVLDGKQVLVGGGAGTNGNQSALAGAISATLESTGAVRVSDAASPSDEKLHALVFDATSLDSPSALRALYDFFHASIGRVARSGRVIVVGRPAAEARARRRPAPGSMGLRAPSPKKLAARAPPPTPCSCTKARSARAGRSVPAPPASAVTAQPFLVTRDVAGAPRLLGAFAPEKWRSSPAPRAAYSAQPRPNDSRSRARTWCARSPGGRRAAQRHRESDGRVGAARGRDGQGRPLTPSRSTRCAHGGGSTSSCTTPASPATRPARTIEAPGTKRSTSTSARSTASPRRFAERRP